MSAEKRRLGGAHDHGSGDDFLSDVEVYFAFVVEGCHVGIVRRQSFMPRPYTKIVQDRIRRDGSFIQVQRVRRQFRLCLPRLHWFAWVSVEQRNIVLPRILSTGWSRFDT